MSQDTMPDLQKWVSSLEKLGYKSFYEVINSKDMGIPQNRQRFFMISFKEDCAYEFPHKLKLKYRLKDFLEKQVDEKYYLSKRMVEYITNTNEKWTGNNGKQLVNRDIGCTINTAPTQRRCDASNYIADGLPENTDLKRLCGIYDKDGQTHQAGSIYDKNGLSPTLDCSNGGGNRQPFITEYSEESLNRIVKNVVEGDEVPTITANAMQSINHQNCALVKEEYGRQALNETLDKYDVKDGTFIDAYNRDINNEVAGAITTRINDSNNTFVSVKNEDMYTELEKTLFLPNGNIRRYLSSDKVDEFKEGQMATTTYPDGYGHGPRTHDMSIALNTIDKPSVKQNLRIRKITPKECFRLMAFEDIDADRMKESGLSESAMYKISGDSIVVTVLIGIFSQLFGDELYENIIEKYVERIKEYE